MRWTTAAVIMLAVLAVLVAPASSATVNPRVLVLAASDAPRYYLFDEDNSLALSRPRPGSADRRSKQLLEAGFESGYVVRYLDTRSYRYVYSAAFVFARAAGAKRYFAQMTRAMGHATHATRIDLGAGARLYGLKAPDTGTAIVWRHSRVVAYVTCAEMTRHRELAVRLARKQERRISASLD